MYFLDLYFNNEINTNIYKKKDSAKNILWLQTLGKDNTLKKMI